MGSASRGGLQHQRHQMGLRLVALAQQRLGMGARGIEVTQTHRAQSIGVAVVVQHLLDHPFAAAIRVDRGAWVRLVDGRVKGFAKDRGGGRKHEPLHPMVAHGPQQREGVGDVVGVVLGRVGDRFRHLNARGKVHDGVEPVLREQAVEPCGISHVAFDQATVQHGVPVARAQVVQHRHLHAALAQQPDHMRANVARAAHHQNMRSMHFSPRLAWKALALDEALDYANAWLHRLRQP